MLVEPLDKLFTFNFKLCSKFKTFDIYKQINSDELNKELSTTTLFIANCCNPLITYAEVYDYHFRLLPKFKL